MWFRKKCFLCFSKLPYFRSHNEIHYNYLDGEVAKEGVVKICDACAEAIDTGDIKDSLEEQIAGLNDESL